MTLKELNYILKINTNINNDKKIKNIKIDSRKIKKGDVFLALKGLNYDGNDYVDDAINKGAIACITNKYINNKCIVVNDTYKALANIANYIKEKYNKPLIGITGSNGKTTTKELLTYILKEKYNVLSNKESKNNIIGVSNTLFKLNNKHDLIVMELGTNHIGEINSLSSICKPDCAIITNIGTNHIGYFKSKKNIFKEKISIRDNMDTSNIIINGDDKYLRKLKYYKCGINLDNDLIAYNICEDINFISFNIFIDKEYKVIFNNPGKHFINNILLVIKVCMDYNIPINTIIKKIKEFKITDKRMNIIKCNNTIINDCYNASYESVKAGIEYLKNIKEDKIIILGDILELGIYSIPIHKKINKLLKNITKKEVYTVGNYSKYIKGKHFNTNLELINYLNKKNINNKYIYIKGSRKMNLDKIVNYFINKK